MEKTKRFFDWLFILLFFTTLGVPVVTMMAGYKEMGPDYENRNKAPLPGISVADPVQFFADLRQLPARFRTYFNDNYSFRESLISVYTSIKTGIFNTNPFPAQVVRGSGDWLFLGDASSDEIRESKGLLTFTDMQLNKIVANVQSIRHTLDSMNIRFYLAIAPNKTTVYGQYLPILHTGKPTKLDQVKAALHSNGIDIVDLKEGFNDYPPGVLFYKTDSHWNDHGIFIGYLNLMHRMKRDGIMIRKIHKITDYRQRVSGQKIIELVRVLRQPSIENKLAFVPKYKNKATLVISTTRKIRSNIAEGFSPYFHYKCKGNSLKILIFHDSFFLGLHQFVMDGFGETVLTRDIYTSAAVLEEKPDIVVYELVERHLDLLLDKVQ